MFQSPALWHGWCLLKYLSPPTRISVYPHLLKKEALNIVGKKEKYMSESTFSQFNKNYQMLTLSLLARFHLWRECTGKTKIKEITLIFNPLVKMIHMTISSLLSLS